MGYVIQNNLEYTNKKTGNVIKDIKYYSNNLGGFSVFDELKKAEVFNYRHEAVRVLNEKIGKTRRHKIIKV
jgi:hypothetical protein